MSAQYFIKLLEYDKYANLLMVDLMLPSGNNTGKPADLMAHMMAAQRTWLLRCQGLPTPGIQLWAGGNAESLKTEIEQKHADWVAFLNGVTDSDIEQPITYTNSRGETYTDSMRDILTHVINHGTHHRAQVGMLLKQNGVEQLPSTDYIFYARSKR